MARIVAIGASQGGVQALRVLVDGLPPNFPAPVLVVQHIGTRESILPSLLNEVAALDVSFALHRELLVAGRIYVAPPDQHMLIGDGRTVDYCLPVAEMAQLLVRLAAESNRNIIPFQSLRSRIIGSEYGMTADPLAAARSED